MSTTTKQKPRTAEEILARRAALRNELTELDKEASETLKAELLVKLKAAFDVYDAMLPDNRCAVYDGEEFKTMLKGLELAKVDDVLDAKAAGKTRAKRVSDEAFLAYLANEHTEAEIVNRYGFKPTTLAQKLSRLKGKSKITSREVDGVKKWKAAK